MEEAEYIEYQSSFEEQWLQEQTESKGEPNDE